MARQRFQTTRRIDLLFLGLAVLAILVIGSWAGLNCLRDGTMPALCLGALLAAIECTALFVFVVVVSRRIAFQRNIAFVTRQGVVVMKSGLPVVRAAVEDEIDRVFGLWQRWKNSPLLPEWEAIRGIVLCFWSMGAPKPSWGIGRPETIHVEYNDDLTKTTLAHELGRVIIERSLTRARARRATWTRTRTS